MAAGEGQIENTVVATSSDGQTAMWTDNNYRGGVLHVSKAPAAGQPLFVKKGDPVTYTITINNTGASTVPTNVLVSEGVSGGTWSGAQGFTLPGANADGQLKADSFRLDSIAAGATLTVDYTMLAGEGVLANNVTVADGGYNNDTDTNTYITAGVLRVDKAPAQGQPLIVYPGSRVAYNITIANIGSVTTLEDVLISETMAGIWSQAVGFDLAAAKQPNGSLLIDSIAPATTLSVRYTVVADSGQLQNKVVATNGDGNDSSTFINTSVMVTLDSNNNADGLPQSGNTEGLQLIAVAITLLSLGVVLLTRFIWRRRQGS
jgi:uncharacterized repeat protein (TIGR01451 family)